jgi:hypothetical protein
MSLRFAASLLASFLLVAAAHAAAPALATVTPPDGATQVSPTSSLVFTFDQEMDTNSPPIQSGSGYAGAFGLTATGFNQSLVGVWSVDRRTLTISPSIQFPLATFTWTLNPTGPVVVSRIRNAAFVELPTISGTFTTGAAPAAPHLLSAVPANNGQGIATNTIVQFHFDLAMKKLTAVELASAILWTGIDPAKLNYTWSADAKTLFCAYTGGFPKDAAIAWLLNPSAATVKFESATGIALPSDTYKGAFFTTGPESACSFGALPATWGSFSINKFSNYTQASDADPLPINGGAFAFTSSIQGSSTSAVTAASITFPDAAVSNLFVFNGSASFFASAATRAALNIKYPAAEYTLRFTQVGQPERVIPMTFPVDGEIVPKILNFTEAQTVNPAADFTLRWNQFLNTTASNYLSVIVIDPQSRIVFRAPNPCVPRPLAPTDTSVVIPAHLLQTNTTYTAYLQFGNQFYYDTNSFVSMTGSGNLGALTKFTVKTTGGGVTIAAPTFSNFQLLPNGNPQFQITGTIAQIYAIERTPALPPTWNEIGSVTIQAGGNATFEDTQPNKTLPLFYRAVAR